MYNSILIVEDDLTFSKMLQVWFSKKKYTVTTALKVSEAKKKIKQSVPEVIICDLRLPKEDGISLLTWVKKNYPKVVVIMMTGYAEIQTAVRAIKLGAYDYISKPINPTELFDKINEAFQLESKNNDTLTDTPVAIASTPQYVKGNSLAYKNLYKHIELVAPTDMTVLIKGDSGVGKEHIAREIHEKSKRKEYPFVAIDCGVLSKDLAASDLFGHIKGAFTGALTDKIGFFLSANKGTVFLDEIGNLSIDVQVRLLRALQEKKIKPVGSEKEVEVDIRILTATNEDIAFAVQNGYFRTDLYHRISEFVLEVPALKEVKEDIPQFLNYFLQQSNKTLGKNIKTFSNETLEILTQYEWTGNIREMKNIVNRLTLLSQSETIEKELLPNHFILKKEHKKDQIIDDQNEKKRIEDALRFTQYNYIKTAAILSLDTKQLFAKMQRYNISNA